MTSLNHEFDHWYERFLAKSGLVGRRLGVERESLELIHQQFVFSIPFDMLDSYYGQSRLFEIETVLRKVLLSERGGGCSEVNEVLLLILAHIGIENWRIMARVFDPTEPSRFNFHKALVARVEDQLFLCDVGMGDSGPVWPVPLDGSISSQPGDRKFKIDRQPDESFTLNRFRNGRWLRLYAFEIAPMDREVFVLVHLRNNRNPRSRFVQHRYVSILTPTGYKRIVDNQFTRRDRHTHERTRLDEESLPEVLKAEFRIVPNYSLDVRKVSR